MNLLKLVSQRLDERVLGLLGAALGEHEVRIRDGIEAAVPAVLTSMQYVTQTESGKEMLWRELRDTDSDLAFDFEKSLRFRSSDQLIEHGSNQLRGLVGSKADAVVMSVSRASDLGSTSARKLVGAITPLVFACVAKHQQDVRIDANGLSDLLSAQAEFCTPLVPKGLESGLAASSQPGITSDIALSATGLTAANSPAAASGTGYGFAPRTTERTSTTDQKFAEFSQTSKLENDGAKVSTGESIKPIYESESKQSSQPVVTKVPTSGKVDHERINRIENGIKSGNAGKSSSSSTASVRDRSSHATTPSSSGELHWLWWPFVIAASVAALIFMAKKMDTTPGIAELIEPPFFLDEGVQTPVGLVGNIEETEAAGTKTSSSSQTDSDADNAEAGEANADGIEAESKAGDESSLDTPGPATEDESDEEEEIVADDEAGAEDGIPADDQVETLIEKLSTVVASISDEDSAKKSKSALAASATSLEELLGKRDTWKVETVELVDLQLGDEAKKLKEKLTSFSDDEAISKVLKKELKRFGKIFDAK